MEGSEYQGDTRSVSELYGSVLMVSIALITALILLGLGSVLLDHVASDTEDAIAQDAMLEMDDRLTDIAGSGADATTTFTLPEGSNGRLSVQPDHGVVNISIETNVSADELLHVDETSNSTEIPLGTIQYIDSNDHVTAYQGGAVFVHRDGYSEMLSRPAFDFDGEQIALSFLNLSNIESVQADTEVSATKLTDESRASSEELFEWLSQYWLVGSGGEAHAVAPVHINITIESAYADGWGLYALEGMQEPLDSDQVHIEDDRVTMEFFVGGEPDMSTSPDDWDEVDPQTHFVYAGLSQFAQYSTHLDPVDGGPAFQFNRTQVTPDEEFVALYHFKADGPNGWVAFEESGEQGWVGIHGYDEYFDPEEDVDELAVVEHEDDLEYAPGVRERPDGEGLIYHIESDNPVCAAGASYMDSETHFENDCLEYMFMVPNNDTEAIIESTGYMITEVDVTPNNPDEGETITVDVTVENAGETSSSQYVQLRNFDGEIVDVERSSVLAPTEEEELTLEWETEGGDAGVGDLVISTEDVTTREEVEIDPTLSLEITDIDPNPIEAPDPLTVQLVTVTVEGEHNPGGGPEITAYFDGEEKDSDSMGGGDEVELYVPIESSDYTGTLTVGADVPGTKNVTERIVVKRDAGPDCDIVTYQGSGTSSSPYQIETVAQLQCMGHEDTSTTLSDNFELVDDIDAHGTGYWNDEAGFEPIGDESTPFTGTFDGQGHEIDGLTIDRPTEGYVGLFGATDGAVVENVDMEGVDVVGETVVGGVVGSASGPIEMVSVTGSVEATDQTAGGIVGELNSGADISFAYSTADVTAPSAAGGIVGSTGGAEQTFEQLYWAAGDLSSGGGAIAGESAGGDEFTDSVYYDSSEDGIGDEIDSATTDYNSISQADMRGSSAEDELPNLDWSVFQPVYDVREDGSVENEDFPAFERNVDGFLVDASVEDDTITEGETFEVSATVENFYDETTTQDVLLLNTRGHTVDRATGVTLDPGESTSLDFTWETQWRDASYDSNPLVVQTEDSNSHLDVTIEEVDAPVDSIGRVVGDSDHPMDIRTTEIVIQE